MKKIIATLVMGLLLSFAVIGVSAKQNDMRQDNMSSKRMMKKHHRQHRKMMRKHHRQHRRMMKNNK